MSDKARVSASVDQEVADYLQRDVVNASGLINKLVKQHQASGGTKRAMLELRREQLRSEVDDFSHRLEMKKTQLEQVKNELEQLDIEQSDKVSEAAELLSYSDFERETMKLNYWMDETGLDKDELREAIEDYDNDTT